MVVVGNEHPNNGAEGGADPPPAAEHPWSRSLWLDRLVRDLTPRERLSGDHTSDVVIFPWHKLLDSFREKAAAAAPSAPPAAASGLPTRTRSPAAASACATCSTRSGCAAGWRSASGAGRAADLVPPGPKAADRARRRSRSSTSTLGARRAAAPLRRRRSLVPRRTGAARASACSSKARRARCSTSTTAPTRTSPAPTTTPAARAAAPGVAPTRDRQRDRHRQGLHHARRRRSVPDRADGRRRRVPAQGAATSTAPSPAGRAAAAGSTPSVAALRGRASTASRGLALTKLDVLSGLETLEDLHRATSSTASEVTELPGDYEELERVKPIYETLPGWDENLGGCPHPRRSARERASATCAAWRRSAACR